MKKIILIGGGIAGLCSAYYLIKEGFEVSIIDSGDISKGASFINAGYLTPSHFVPLAEPGMFGKGLKSMLNSSSPFYVKPRLDLDFFKWIYHFIQSSTSDKVEKALPVLLGINLKSRDLFEEMHASVDFHFHYEKKGILMAFKNAESEEHEMKLAQRAAIEGLEVEEIAKKDLHKVEPLFSDDVIGAVHYQCDAHTTPGQFMANLKSWLENNGANFILNEEVLKIKSQMNLITAIETKKGIYEADEFVFTAGSWTSCLGKMLNINIPIQGGKGYCINVLEDTGIRMPAILVEGKVAVTPMAGFTRFAGTMEFSGNNNFIRKPRVSAIANSAESYYKNLKISEDDREAAVSGLRPVSPDGLPFIGRASTYKNLTVAAGHSMMGWSLGPITGKLVSQIISEKSTSINLDPFKVERFRLKYVPF